MAEGNVYARMSAVLTMDNKEFLTSLEKTSRKLGAFGKKAEALGRNLTRSVTLPLVAMGAAATKMSVEFERQLATVAAVSGATGDELAKLTQNAKELGSTTVFSATQVAQLQEELARLGFSADEITGATQSILALAQATGTDLADAASIVGTAIRAFNLEISQTSHLADVFASATANSALSMETLKESLSEFAPIAASLNLTVEQSSALLAVLADRGIKGSKAGNALKAVFAGLKEKGADFNEVLEKVRDGSIGMTEAIELVGRRGATALLALGQVSDTELRQMIGQFENSQGAAIGMAAVMDDTLFGSMKSLQSATEGLAISFGETLAPLVGSLTEAFTKFARSLDALSDKQKRQIAAFAATLAIAGPLLIITGKLSKAMKAGILLYKQELAAIVANTTAKKVNSSTTVASTAATAADTVGKTANAAATNAATTASLRLAAAARVLKTALVRTGIGALVVGLGYVIEKLLFATEATDEFRSSQDGWSRVAEKIETNVGGTAAKLKDLALAYKDATGDMERQKFILKQIGAEDDTLVEGIEAGKDAYDELIGRIDDYIDKLKQAAMAQAAQAELSKLYEKQFANQRLENRIIEAFYVTNEEGEIQYTDGGAMTRDFTSTEQQVAALKEIQKEYGDVLTNIFESDGMLGVRKVPLTELIDALIDRNTNQLKRWGIDMKDGGAEVVYALSSGWSDAFGKTGRDIQKDIDDLLAVIQENRAGLGDGIDVGGGDDGEFNFTEAQKSYNDQLAFLERWYKESGASEEEYLRRKAQLTNQYAELLTKNKIDATDYYNDVAQLLKDADALAANSDFASRLTEERKFYNDEVAAGYMTQEQANQALAGWLTLEAEAATTAGETARAVNLLAMAQKLLTTNTEETITPLQTFNDTVEVLGQKLNAGLITKKQYNEALGQAYTRLSEAAFAAKDYATAIEYAKKAQDAFAEADAADFSGHIQMAQQFANVVGTAFLEATDGSKDFFTSLKDGFLQAFKAMIAKLITLIAMFGILNLLTGGTFAATGGANGGSINLGQFIGQGFGFNTKSLATAPGGGGGTDTKSLNVTGTIDNGVIALSNSQGTVRNQRMYGG